MLSTKHILTRLRDLREEKLLNQESLARRLGIDRTTYIRKEKGFIPITTEEWLKLAEAMGKDPDFFFHSEERNSSEGPGESKEEALLRLYRSLSPQERSDLVACVRLLLKGVKRKKVRDTLEMLCRP